VDYNLRTARPGDEEALSLVGAASFLEAFAGMLQGPDILAHCRKQHAVEKYRAWLTSANSAACIAEVKQAPVGYAVVCPPDLPVPLTERDIELKRIYVFHRFQGMGIGKALIEWSFDEARKRGFSRVLLGVNEGNTDAIAFYMRCGFVNAGHRSFQVGDQICQDEVLARVL